MHSSSKNPLKLAIIPARGGSKRIPRKNIKMFCGKPMLVYPIQAALESGVIDKIIVSTDDDEIAQIALDCGAEVPFLRSKTLADDHTGTTAVVRDTLERLNADGWEISHCACIYATSPLLSGSTIRQAYQQLTSSNSDYVFTAARFSFPIQRALLRTPQGGVTPFDPQSIAKRSQDLADTFHDAGQLYWGTVDSWLDTSRTLFSAQSQMLVLPNYMVQDIDTAEDWQRAELLYQLLQQVKSP